MKFLILVSLLFSSLAFAGKEERDYKTNQAEPIVKAAADSFKANCGCPLKIDVKWEKLVTVDQMRGGMRTLQSITENSKDYCKDAGSKKAMCAMKTLELSLSPEATIAFANGKLSVTTNTIGDSSFGWDQITKTVDK